MIEEESKLVDKFGKKRPFRVPEGYFSTVQQQVVEQITTSQNKRRSIFLKYSKPITIAATILLAVVITGFLYSPSRPQAGQLAEKINHARETKIDSSAIPISVLQNQNASILPLNTSSLSKSVSKSETHHKSLKVEETATPSDKHTPKQSKPATKEAASTDIIDVAVEYFMLDDDDMYALMTDEFN